MAGTSSKRTTKKPVAKSSKTVRAKSKSRIIKLRHAVTDFMARRPHRSFRPTRRRDYVRSLQLPGYISFTALTLRTLRQRWKTYALLIFAYAIATILLVGIASQETYNTLSDVLVETGDSIFEGAWGEIGQAGLLLLSGLSGSLTPQLTEAQQIFSILLFVFTWLTTVWLIRAQLAGNKPRLRDAVYSAGAPLIPTTLISLLLVIQLVPAALAIIGYSAALSTDFLANGFISMIFFLIAFLLIVLSLYMVTTTFFALIVVTLPGMYPWQAIRTAGDLVIGRRIRILLRMIWAIMVSFIAWAFIMIPIIIVTTWLQTAVPALAWVPIVPVTLTALSAVAIVFVSTYTYLLYRKVVEDDAKPA